MKARMMDSFRIRAKSVVGEFFLISVSDSCAIPDVAYIYMLDNLGQRTADGAISGK